MKKLISAATFGAVVLSTGIAQAGVTANLGVTSNYLWRGVTQTDNRPAVQGGVDYAHDSGFYAGTWLSNVDFGTTGFELDLYAGWSGEFSGFTLDLGYIQYMYPAHNRTEAPDFGEIYGTVGWGPLSTGIYYDVFSQEFDDAGNDLVGSWYVPLSFDWNFENVGNLGDVGLKVFGGYYDINDSGSYFHWGVGLSKPTDKFGTFGIQYEQANTSDDADNTFSVDEDAMVLVNWSMDFEIM